MRKYVVYIIQSRSTGERYVGSTSDIERRLREHNSGKTRYTSKNKDWEMVYKKEFEEEKESREYEMKIKRNKKYRKEFYTEAGFPV